MKFEIEDTPETQLMLIMMEKVGLNFDTDKWWKEGQFGSGEDFVLGKSMITVTLEGG